MLPKAQRENLQVEENGDGLVVRDEERGRIHRLNRTTAFVWQHSDGETSVKKMADLLHKELGLPASTDIVWVALDQLDKAQLLGEPLRRSATQRRMDRRQTVALGLTGALALMLPGVTTRRAAAAPGRPRNISRRPLQPRGPNTAAIRRRNRATARQITKAFNTGNTGLIDRLVHKGVLDYAECPGLEPGLEGVKEQISMLREQFPDAFFRERALIAEGDTVILMWEMSGTNTGSIYGRPPTGRRIVHQGTEYIRLKDGKVVEHADNADVLEFLDKLGLLDDDMLRFLRNIGFRP